MKRFQTLLDLVFITMSLAPLLKGNKGGWECSVNVYIDGGKNLTSTGQGGLQLVPHFPA